MAGEKDTPEGNKELFVMGCADLSRRKFLTLLQQYGLNCVVDVRCASEQDVLSEALLKQDLSEQGAHYLPFVQEFGSLPKSFLHRNLNADYAKALRSEAFLRGVERLRRGLERGFHIVLIDGMTNAADSYRLSLVACYFQSLGITVKNILTSERPLRYIVLGDPIPSDNNGAQHTAAIDTKPVPTHTEMGRWGEEVAAEYLRAKGYKIVERNWHYRHREIDIIAYAPYSGTLCFVEVKARRNDHFGDPEFAVNRKKMWFLTIAANHYIRSRAIDTQAQFDVIAITGTPRMGYRLVHIPDAIPASVRTTHR